MRTPRKRTPKLAIVFVSILAIAIVAIIGLQFSKAKNFWRKQPQIDIGVLEWRIHELTNVERRSQGIPELQFDNRLADVARSHSQDMANKGFYQHINLNGEDPTARGEKMAYKCVKKYATHYTEGISENLMRTYLYNSVLQQGGITFGYDWRNSEEIAKISVDGWMDSTGHRSTLLTPTYDREGIGVVISRDREVFVTQNFC